MCQLDMERQFRGYACMHTQFAKRWIEPGFSDQDGLNQGSVIKVVITTHFREGPIVRNQRNRPELRDDSEQWQISAI